MIKHLIFDFGGVFLYLEGENKAVHYNLHKLLNIPEEKAVEIWKKHKDKLLVGEETPKEFLTRINALMGTDAHPDAAHDSWLNMNKEEPLLLAVQHQDLLGLSLPPLSRQETVNR